MPSPGSGRWCRAAGTAAERGEDLVGAEARVPAASDMRQPLLQILPQGGGGCDPLPAQIVARPSAMLRHPLFAHRAQRVRRRRRSAEEQQNDTHREGDRAANPHNGSDTHPWIIGNDRDECKPIRGLTFTTKLFLRDCRTGSRPTRGSARSAALYSVARGSRTHQSLRPRRARVHVDDRLHLRRRQLRANVRPSDSFVA